MISLREKDNTLQPCGNSLGRLTLKRLLESRQMKSNAGRSYESSQVSMPDLISCKQQQQKNTEEVDYLKKVLTCLFPFLCPLAPLPVCSFPCLEKVGGGVESDHEEHIKPIPPFSLN